MSDGPKEGVKEVCILEACTNFDMESNISTSKIAQDFEGITLAKNTAMRRRRHSLFETKELPKIREGDHGVAVMTHADYPLRSRSKSLPFEPEKRKIPIGFEQENVRKLLREVLESKLKGRSYVASECAALTRELVNIMRDKVAALDLNKYKFICTCCITQKLKPPLAMQSGCAWDESTIGIDKDGFAEFVYKNDDLIAVATVYGVHAQKRTQRQRCIKSIKGSIYSPIPE